MAYRRRINAQGDIHDQTRAHDLRGDAETFVAVESYEVRCRFFCITSEGLNGFMMISAGAAKGA